jgi:hypothetical protein
MKKSGKLACHAVDSNIAIDSMPTIQISLGIVVPLSSKNYDGELIFTVSLISGSTYLLQCTIYITDIDAVLGNNYCLQIIETGFAEQF